MRLATNFAALVALGCVGFAIGDWARHPNALGMLGILALIAVFGFLLSYLYKPRTDTLRRPPPPPPPPPSTATRPRRRNPGLSGPPAGWGDGDDADNLWSDR